jgi:LmbE family N-acetylglucosaminyl deacetylase
MSERILILSPHTDDAELGCGGFISRLIDEGKSIMWLVFSTAEESLPKGFPPNTLAKEFLNVANYFRLRKTDHKVFDFKVRKLHEKRQDVLEELVSVRKNFKPDLVIGPSLNDFHQDHSVVANEMIRAFKTSSSIICYELPWNHIRFETQFFVRLSEKNIDDKAKVLQFYESQHYVKKGYFSTDFVKGLAITRGTQIGERYAEAFEVVRWIQ